MGQAERRPLPSWRVAALGFASASTLSLLVGIAGIVDAQGVPQELPRHIVLTGGIHYAKLHAGGEVALGEHGTADFVQYGGDHFYGVLVMNARIAEDLPLSPSRYSFWAHHYEGQAAERFTKEANDAARPPVYVFVWNATPTPKELSSYDEASNVTYDDREVGVAYNSDLNLATVWCPSFESCDEVRGALEGALRAQLRRRADVFQGLSDIEEAIGSLDRRTKPPITELFLDEAFDDASDLRQRLQEIPGALHPDIETDGNTVGLPGLLRDPLVASIEGHRVEAERARAAAFLELDAVEEKALRIQRGLDRDEESDRFREAILTDYRIVGIGAMGGLVAGVAASFATWFLGRIKGPEERREPRNARRHWGKRS